MAKRTITKGGNKMFVVFDGRYPSDPNRATVIDTIVASSREDAVKEFKSLGYHRFDYVLTTSAGVIVNV